MHDNKKLSVSAAFTAAGKQLLRQPLFLIGVMFLVAGVGLVGSWLLDTLTSSTFSGVFAVLMTIIAAVGSGFVVYGKVLELGFKKIALQLVRGDEADFEDIFVSIHQGVRYIVGVILFNILVVGIPVAIIALAISGTTTELLLLADTTAGSLALAVVLGLAGYLALIFHLFPFVLLDQNYGVVKSFHTAWSITENAIFDLIIFYGVAFLLNLIGAVVFMVGLLITVPLTVLAQAHAYQQLSKGTFSYND
jgi:uncharacterized membrane protein